MVTKVFGYPISKKKVVLLLVDVVIIVTSVLLAAGLRLGVKGGLAYVENNLFSFILMGFIFLLTFYMADLYDFKKDFRSLGQILIIIAASILSLSFSALSIYLFRLMMPGRGVFFLSGILVTLGIVLWRQVYSFVAVHPPFKVRTAIIGVDKPQRTLIGNIGKEKRLGVELVGFIHQEPLDREDNIEALPCLGKLEELENLVERDKIGQMILADNYQVPDNLKASLSRCLLKGVKVTDIPKFYIENWQRIPLEGTSRDWLYQEFARKSAPDPYLEKFRRVVDIALASLGLALSSPLYIPISLAIKLDSQGPVFYRQERLGKGKKAFSLLKFRTMVKDAEKDTGAVWAGEDDPRITRVGNFLRKTRLDELPQFINVLKGEMSLVGPRPEREEFVNQFLENIPYYPMRLLVKPGITGWAQVKYGYVNSLKGTKDKLEYDLYYILNQSLLLDVGILLKTIRIVLWGQRR